MLANCVYNEPMTANSLEVPDRRARCLFHTCSKESFLLHVEARYGVKQGMVEEVLDRLGDVAADTRQEPGNVSYEFYQGVEAPGQNVILEAYHDVEDFDRHRETDHFLRLGAGCIIPRLVIRSVSNYTTKDKPHEAP